MQLTVDSTGGRKPGFCISWPHQPNWGRWSSKACFIVLFDIPEKNDFIHHMLWRPCYRAMMWIHRVEIKELKRITGFIVLLRETSSTRTDHQTRWCLLLSFDQKSYFFIRPSFLEVGTRVTLLQKWCFFSSLPYLLSMNSTKYYPESSTRCFNLVSGLCPSPAIPEGVGKPDRMDRHPLCQLHYNDQTGEVDYQWTNTKFTKSNLTF